MGPKHQQQKNTPRPTETKKRGKPHHQPPTPPSADSLLPLELQQSILNAFSSAFPLASRSDLLSIIQSVKGHLFNRDFVQAFSTQDYLDAYALRWSASRALAYSDIFASLDVRRRWAETPDTSDAAEDPIPVPSASKVVCIGGGAGAEVVALAAAIRLHALPPMTVLAIDVADWSGCLERLERSLITFPVLSPYAAITLKAANRPLIAPNQLHVQFTKQDVLDCKEDSLRVMLAGASLVTIMFTLNELFTTSISRTTAFLLALTDAMESDSWLLVVDSPGSYSEVKLGKEGQVKRYPMQWLLDHTLQQVAGVDRNGKSKWRKFVGEESKWFRIKDRMRYPIELENMRYQMHLYHRQAREEAVGVE